MGRKKEKTINLTELEPKEKLKYEIAEELGLLDRVMQDGWKSLTSKETGRIGGMVTGRRREIKMGRNYFALEFAEFLESDNFGGINDRKNFNI